MTWLLGILIGGTVAAISQWVLTPLVQQRIRAAERVESASMELGHLLTTEIPGAIPKLKRAGSARFTAEAVMKDRAWSEEPPHIVEYLVEQNAELQQAAASWAELTGHRLRWLVMLCGLEKNMVWYRYQLALMRCPTRGYEVESLTETEMVELWRVEAEARTAMQDELMSQMPTNPRNVVTIRDMARMKTARAKKLARRTLEPRKSA